MRVSFCRCAVALLGVGPPSSGLAQVPAGGEFRVNSYTVGMQTVPDVGADASGAFVVAWSGQYGSLPRVFAQRFDASGAPRGAEFQVSASTTSFINFGAISVSRRGEFLAAWSASSPGEPGGDIVARTFDASGNPRGPQFAVNTYTTGAQRYAAVASLPGARYVVVWEHWPEGTPFAADVAGRLFDADGNALTPEFAVNKYTTMAQGKPRVAAADDGRFVVVWQGDGATGFGVFGQRFDATGARVGEEFQVNEATTFAAGPSLSLSAGGEFVVVWRAPGPGTNTAILGRVFDRDASPMGTEFVVATSTGIALQNFDVASDQTGNFTVAWQGPDGPDPASVSGRRYAASGAPRGAAFRVNTYTTGYQQFPVVASDPSGNVIASWASDQFDTQFVSDVYVQRYGGLLPASLSVVDGDQGVLDVPDDFFLRTAWRNVNGLPQTFQGRASDFDVPPGMLLNLSADANYGTVPSGAVGMCGGPCFSGALLGTRPTGHVDIRFTERILPEVQGQAQRWTLHVGGTFTDVVRTNTFYPFVETLMHHGVTSGCGGMRYCPAGSTTREQMAVFVLTAKEGPGYAPRACTTPLFNDVPASSPFCPWIEELARREVTSGCGPGLYCPTAAVSREQMAVFVLRTLDPSLDPPACTTPMFTDVPASSAFCRWIEELARRGVVSGCAPQRYCPTDPVTREQMAVFLTGTFGLTLYGP